MDSAESKDKVEPSPEGATATPKVQAPQSATPLIATIVIAVLVAAGGLTFTMLNTRATAAAAATTALATAPMTAGTALPSAASVAAFSAPKWSHAHAYRWVSNRPRSVAFELESIERVPVWTTTVRPMLVVRCLSRKTELFVYTETAARIESDDENHTVGLAFDGGPQSVERWPDSEEHDALFAPDSSALATRIASAHHLKFTFTPHNAQPATVNFDLTGADEVVASVRKTCGAR
jgi:hypothetical protein